MEKTEGFLESVDLLIRSLQSTNFYSPEKEEEVFCCHSPFTGVSLNAKRANGYMLFSSVEKYSFFVCHQTLSQ